MEFKDIKNKYKDEWVLIECLKVDSDTFDVLEGNVLYHSADMGKVYSKVLEVRPKDYTIEYFGDSPENLAVVV